MSEDDLLGLVRQAIARWHEREHCMTDDPAEQALVFVGLNRVAPVGVVRALVAEVYEWRARAVGMKINAEGG